MALPTYRLLSSQTVDSAFSPDDIIRLLLGNRRLPQSKHQQFLSPPHPASLPRRFRLNRAASLIRRSIIEGKKILIYGDYDVDGLASTALLWTALNHLRADVTPFVPDRHLDGYGFNSASFFRLQKEKGVNFDLLITVDNGIVAAREFAKINPELTKIIVVDHHLPPASLPPVAAVVHSASLSASGLAWFLANRLTGNADLGLAALGTVADSLPLLGLNRSLVVHGLNSLRVDPNPGLKQLIASCRLKPDSLSTHDLGFIIGPRLNAVGRLSNPTDALRLLCAPSASLASRYVPALNDYNQNRQQLQSEMLNHAEKLYLRQPAKDRLIFVSGPEYHQGVIGLIAGRLTEKYHLPSIAISQNGDISKGSCRSIPPVNIIEELRRFENLFTDLGGHALAAGFSIKNQNIPVLQKRLTSHLNRLLKGVDLKPVIEVDAQMKLSSATVKNIKAISQLEPFGLGNPRPLFLFKGLQITAKKAVGSTGDHLKLKFDDPSTPRPENVITDAIAFKMGDREANLKIGQTLDLIASLDLNTWNNYTSPQLVVKEILL